MKLPSTAGNPTLLSSLLFQEQEKKWILKSGLNFDEQLEHITKGSIHMEKPLYENKNYRNEVEELKGRA